MILIFQDGNTFDDDVSNHSDTSQETLYNKSEPDAPIYTGISDEGDDNGDVISIVITET